MKIGISGYVGPRKTGVGRTLENILYQWSKKKNRNSYYLFCNKDNYDFDPVCNSANIIKKKIHLSRGSSLLNLLWHQCIYQFQLLQNKIDISYIPNATWLIWKVCPTVVVIHDLIEFNISGKFGRLRTLYRKIAYPQSARRADFIITVSENSKNDIVRFCKVAPEKIEVIYNGIDNVFKPLDRSLTQATLNKYQIHFPYVLYVGTIDHPGKNSISLIRALKKIKANHPQYKLVLVGKPGYGYNYIESEIRKLQLQDDVLITGYVSDSDLVGLYNGATVFAFLSLYEGFGLPLIEAMACGTPVIAADTSSLPEVVGEASFIVKPHDVSKIAENLEELIVNKSVRNEKIQKGLEQARRFSWENTAKQTLEVFENIYAKSSVKQQIRNKLF